ncbi:hypothetical protein [Caballeronia sp. LZ035]|uniref:hypothetical protein n=1 Tax=Caballeronia sp. LZ035 TaxID=3038568 RepID=UPI00285F1F8F|nr:hypothetical protein [Caballeronia sp. LZ035]MDR5762415.1 hypothetical protein [Caballeronia sp. LZ035]
MNHIVKSGHTDIRFFQWINDAVRTGAERQNLDAFGSASSTVIPGINTRQAAGQARRGRMEAHEGARCTLPEFEKARNNRSGMSGRKP